MTASKIFSLINRYAYAHNIMWSEVDNLNKTVASIASILGIPMTLEVYQTVCELANYEAMEEAEA